MRRKLRACAACLTIVLGVWGRAEAGLNLGDILVSDVLNLALYDVNPTTGARVIFSEAGVAGSGVAFSSPQGIAIDPLGFVVVADSGLNALIRVDEATGNRSILSQLGAQGTGLAFTNPLGITTDSAGVIYVADQGGASGSGQIFRVDPLSGNRTLISGNGVGLGTVFDNIGGIAIVGGKLIVADQGDYATPSTLFSVDPTSGARTVLSSGMRLDNVRGVTQGPGGSVYTSNAGGFLTATSPGSVVAVDTGTGSQTTVSSGGAGGVGTGTGFTDPYGIATGLLGRIFVTDAGDSSIGVSSQLDSVDPTTGSRIVLSGGGVGSGPAFGQLGLGIAVNLPTAVVPEPATLVLIGQALVVGLLARSWRLRRGNAPGPASRSDEQPGR